MRYARSLPADFERLLLPGGPLRFLVERVKQADPLEAETCLDLQLREYGKTNRKVTLYRGLTAILNIRLDRKAHCLRFIVLPEIRTRY